MSRLKRVRKKEVVPNVDESDDFVSPSKCKSLVKRAKSKSDAIVDVEKAVTSEIGRAHV